MRKKSQVVGRLRVQPLRLLAADVSETAQVYLDPKSMQNNRLS